jgi:esterase/lipase superfamily enzyme
VLGYSADEANADWTWPHLKQFLTDVSERTGADSVHLIAHSMGNRVLAPALRELSLERKGQPPLFHDVVLTAPDIDAEVFRRDIAPAILGTAHCVTLYASSRDTALKMSQALHRYPRAGDSGEGIVVVPGMQTIDVSAVDTSLEGHNYFQTNRTVLTDLYHLLQFSTPVQQRKYLQPRTLGELAYWAFIPPPLTPPEAGK